MESVRDTVRSDCFQSCPRTEYRFDASFDMKALAGITGRARRRRKEGGAREVRRLLDQPDQRWRVARDADQLQLVAFHAQLGDVGMIRQNLRQRLDDDDACRRLML